MRHGGRSEPYLLLAGAVLISLAYPPFSLFIPSFVCLVPAVLLIERSNADTLPIRAQIGRGFLFGSLSYGLLLYWMVVALWRYTPLSVLGYAATVLVLSVYCAVTFALCGWVVRASRVSILFIFPVFWTALEWVLAHHGDLSFPWLGLGTSLTGFPTTVQIADVVGARGCTFLLALANTALAVAWMKRRDRRQAARLAGSVVIGIVVAGLYGIVREKTLATRTLGEVALLQPNVGYDEKRDPALREVIVGSLFELTTAARRDTEPDLIIWPEVALPGDLGARPDWKRRITTFARRANTPIVAGALHTEVLPDSTHITYNSAFVFDSGGQVEDLPVYHKQYLVPITERVPFLPRGTIRRRWFGSFGAGTGGAVYELGIGKFGVLICYESAFEDLARDYRVRGADFLVNITNDAWFGRTTTPYQHASHLVMRAIENRMGIARAANTGVSGIVDPLGRQHARTELEMETYTSGMVSTSDVLTVYSRLGDWVGGAAALLALTLVAYAWWRDRLSA
jgi:apolipoprotein N-acyltransferase